MSAKPSASADPSPDSARILIIDFGGQYTQLIARRVREVGVYSEILPFDADAADIRAFGPAGIILSGGPESVSAANAPAVAEVVFELGVPILGICYGMQALAARFGGSVQGADHREFGYAEVELTGDDDLLAGLVGAGQTLKVWMSHGDRVEQLPPGFAAIAASKNAPLAGMADAARRYYGVQFHPEVTHTEHGLEIIRRFALDICGCPGDWTPANIIAEHIERVRATVGKDRVLLGLSGGVDSSVVAALLHAAIGDQLICVFVDTGLLRLDEGDQVM
jgi:GMP synthase (glutamine-hydrolysing)